MSGELVVPVSPSAIDTIVRPWWSCWAGLAWGFRRHAVVLWACAGRVDPYTAKSILNIDHPHPFDVVIFYRELCVSLVPEHDLARMIVDATPEYPHNERKHLSRFCAGRNVFEQGRHALRTIADLMNPVLREAGIVPLRETDDSDNSRIVTFRDVFDGLRRNYVLRSDEPPQEKQTGPVIFISEDCPELISAIPSLEADEPKRPEDVKEVGTKQDQIWAAMMNTYRDYPVILAGEPLAVRRAKHIGQGVDAMHKAQLMREFDSKQKSRRIRSR